MPPEKQPSEHLSVSRRGFFRKLLLQGIEQVEEKGKAIRDRALSAIQPEPLKPGLSTVSQDGAKTRIPPDGTEPHTAQELRYLRPPGALPLPGEFAELCSRCGKCVEVCPAHCIKLDEKIAGGLPYIIPRIMPCVICDDLSCMKVCPTGALQLLAVGTMIEMGKAAVDHARCLRTSSGSPQAGSEPSGGTRGEDPDSPAPTYGGEDCQVCVRQCPIGETALAIGLDLLVEVRPGCTGCGVCEQVCPTEPASIIVWPKQPTP